MTAQKLGFAFQAILIWLLFTSWLPARIYLSIGECGIFLLVLCWLSLAYVGEVSLVGGWVSGAMLLPCTGLLQLAAGTAVYPWKTAVTTLDWAMFASVAWLSGQFCGAFDFGRIFQRTLVRTGLIVSVLGAAHWLFSPGLIFWAFTNPYQMRTTFPLLNHSHFAAFLELALAPAIWMAIRARKLDLFHTWAAAAMISAVWVSGSRSGSVIVTFELVAVVLLTLRGVRSGLVPWPRIAVLGICAVVLAAGIGWQSLAARFTEGQRDDLRAVFTRATLGMILERPLLGFGLGSFATVYPAYAAVDTGYFVEHAHDDWLEWASEGGVPAVAVFLLMALLAIRRSASRPWAVGIVAVFIQAAVEFPLHKPAVLAWQMAAVGCIALSRTSSDISR